MAEWRLYFFTGEYILAGKKDYISRIERLQEILNVSSLIALAKGARYNDYELCNSELPKRATYQINGGIKFVLLYGGYIPARNFQRLTKMCV